ncbi:MAG: GGDEF domain-containing protein [Planctomycetota bacterium]|nr:MAG: GGDEF domain-containing protein [Planctomycetota bacterium]
MNTGAFTIASQWIRRLLRQISVVTLVIGIAITLFTGSPLPLFSVVALAAILLAMQPTAQDHVARKLRKRPSQEEIDHLAGEAEVQRSVFDIASDLVGCVSVEECPVHFAQAVRTYWQSQRCECWLWERGHWQLLGAVGDPSAAAGQSWQLTAPVQLPPQSGGTLILDLSPGVSGQAALVLYGAQPQPTLRGQRDCMPLADLLRSQLALTLRRVLLHRDLQMLARKDPLTGADRRWYGEQRLQEALRDGSVVVAMLDIDHFKRVNDTYGHLVGDQVLQRVGTCLRQHLRQGDICYRFGGEEFVLVLPGLPPEAGASVVQRLLQACAEDSGPGPSVTVSAGLTVSHDQDNVATVIERADAACYQAKRSGRNCLRRSDG